MMGSKLCIKNDAYSYMHVAMHISGCNTLIMHAGMQDISAT